MQLTEVIRLSLPAAALAASLPLWSGCTVHEVNLAPEPTVSDEDGAFTYAPSASTKSRKQSLPWWRTFSDPTLDRLVRVALNDNPDVRAAAFRIQQADARVIQAGATLFPLLDGTTGFQTRWDTDGDRQDDASLGLALGWELDVWGRIRSGRSARASEERAVYDDWHGARLLLTAAIAETWLSLLEQEGQLQLAREQIEVNETLLDLTKLRFGQGLSSVTSVYQQQAQLESVAARVPDIESRIGELELALEALVGKMPGNWAGIGRGKMLYRPPPHPDAGLPAELLCRRPDLRAQRARIIALDHEVGEAVADRLPRLSIGGSAALAGTPSLESLVGNAVVAAVGPIFDAGSRKAEVESRRSRVEEEIEIYTALFIDAAREVETALLREGSIAERIRRQEQQLRTSRRLLSESRSQYTRGLTDYLPVLDAVSRVQDLERDLLLSRRELLSSRVALHRALGGPMPEKIAP